MKSLWRAMNRCCFLFVPFLFAAPAAAESPSFEEVAKDAISVAHPQAIASLLWPVTATCSERETDLARRRCRVIRERRSSWAGGATFRVRVRGAATMGTFDETTKTAPVSLGRALVGEDGITWEGQQWEIAVAGGPGAPQGTEALLASAYLTTSQKVWSAADAVRYRNEVAPGLIAEWIVRVPAKPFFYRRKNTRGVLVEALAVRLHDPCSGRILHSQPASKAKVGSREPCRAGQARIGELEDKTPPLPEILLDIDVARAMRPMMKAARKCFEAYEVPGRAQPRMKVSGDGKVLAVEWLGDFAGTPTAACLEKSLTKTSFPKTQRPVTLIEYPIAVNR